MFKQKVFTSAGKCFKHVFKHLFKLVDLFVFLTIFKHKHEVFNFLLRKMLQTYVQALLC